MELKPCRVSKTGMGGVGKGLLPLAANCWFWTHLLGFWWLHWIIALQIQANCWKCFLILFLLRFIQHLWNFIRTVFAFVIFVGAFKKDHPRCSSRLKRPHSPSKPGVLMQAKVISGCYIHVLKSKAAICSIDLGHFEPTNWFVQKLGTPKWGNDDFNILIITPSVCWWIPHIYFAAYIPFFNLTDFWTKPTSWKPPKILIDDNSISINWWSMTININHYHYSCNFPLVSSSFPQFPMVFPTGFSIFPIDRIRRPSIAATVSWAFPPLGILQCRSTCWTSRCRGSSDRYRDTINIYI